MGSTINSLLSVGPFTFFLLVFLVGYIFVEIFFGKDYFFRGSFEKYGNKIFDRIVHYISWGIVLNILFIILIFTSSAIEPLANIFNASGEIAKILEFDSNKGTSIQLLIFACAYFVEMMIIYGFVALFIIIAKYFVNYVCPDETPQIIPILKKVKKKITK